MCEVTFNAYIQELVYPKYSADSHTNFADVGKNKS